MWSEHAKQIGAGLVTANKEIRGPSSRKRLRDRRPKSATRLETKTFPVIQITERQSK
jgi:hypothetical protein